MTAFGSTVSGDTRRSIDPVCSAKRFLQKDSPGGPYHDSCSAFYSCWASDSWTSPLRLASISSTAVVVPRRNTSWRPSAAGSPRATSTWPTTWNSTPIHRVRPSATTGESRSVAGPRRWLPLPTRSTATAGTGPYPSDFRYNSGATLGLSAHVSAPRAITPALKMFRAPFSSLSILSPQATQAYRSLRPGRFLAPHRWQSCDVYFGSTSTIGTRRLGLPQAQ